MRACALPLEQMHGKKQVGNVVEYRNVSFDQVVYIPQK